MKFISNNQHGGYTIEYLGRRYFIQLSRKETTLSLIRLGLAEELVRVPWHVSVDDIPLFLVKSLNVLKEEQDK